MFDIVSLVDAATGSLALATPINALVGSIQAAGGSFVAMKCCWLGIMWRRGTEHGMESFSDVGISSALLVSSVPLGAAIGGGAGAVLAPVIGMEPWNTVIRDAVGYALGVAVYAAPGVYLVRARLLKAWKAYLAFRRGRRA